MKLLIDSVQANKCSPGATGKPWIILNLGCGAKTSPACVNIDWSLRFGLMSNRFVRACVLPFLNDDQMEKVRNLDKVTVCNPIRGIRRPANSVDAVYHSHVLEHIDRDSVMKFFLEIRRVLKPDGIHRIVVPDLQRVARLYLGDFSAERELDDWRIHDLRIKQMFEQCVRRKSAAVLKHGHLRQVIETWVFGDARRRGETHQWMYDEINLSGILREAGFRDIRQVDFRTSGIPNWTATKLDFNTDGISEYKPESIYFECVK